MDVRNWQLIYNPSSLRLLCVSRIRRTILCIETIDSKMLNVIGSCIVDKLTLCGLYDVENRISLEYMCKYLFELRKGALIPAQRTCLMIDFFSTSLF